MPDETLCSCGDYSGKEYTACRIACLSASGFSYHVFLRGLLAAQQAGITDEIHQRLYAAGYVARAKLERKLARARESV